MTWFWIGVALCAVAGGWGLLYYLKRETLKRGQQETKADYETAAKESALQNLDLLSGRSRSDSDVLKRLRDKADHRDKTN